MDCVKYYNCDDIYVEKITGVLPTPDVWTYTVLLIISNDGIYNEKKGHQINYITYKKIFKKKPVSNIGIPILKLKLCHWLSLIDNRGQENVIYLSIYHMHAVATKFM